MNLNQFEKQLDTIIDTIVDATRKKLLSVKSVLWHHLIDEEKQKTLGQNTIQKFLSEFNKFNEYIQTKNVELKTLHEVKEQFEYEGQYDSPTEKKNQNETKPLTSTPVINIDNSPKPFAPTYDYPDPAQDFSESESDSDLEDEKIDGIKKTIKKQETPSVPRQSSTTTTTTNTPQYYQMNESSLVYTCKQCNEKIQGQFWRYRQHLAREHRIHDWFVCLHCRQRFFGSRMLADHIIKLHSNNILESERYRFKCKITGKSFITMPEITNHIAQTIHYHIQPPDGCEHYIQGRFD